MSKKKKITIRYKNLNNKTRRGNYLYISAKGLPPRYYKAKQGVPDSTYIQYYLDKYEKKRKVKGIVLFVFLMQEKP